jgi:hypothetical protein
MFIIIIDQGLWTHELMCRIMSCDQSLTLNKFYINLIYSIFEYVYIYNRSRVMSMRANGPHYGLRLLYVSEGYT